MEHSKGAQTRHTNFIHHKHTAIFWANKRTFFYQKHFRDVFYDATPPDGHRLHLHINDRLSDTFGMEPQFAAVYMLAANLLKHTEKLRKSVSNKLVCFFGVLNVEPHRVDKATFFFLNRGLSLKTHIPTRGVCIV